MLQIVKSDKRSIILNAALEVFVAYGFRKTSMDDIARAAHMSRPALYQTFRNKGEIFRELASEMMTDAVAKARDGFDVPGDFRQRLTNAIGVSVMELNQFIEQTAHGSELVGVSEEVAGDLRQNWLETFAAAIADGIAGADRDGLVTLDRFGGDAAAVASVFALALEGLKSKVELRQPIADDVKSIIDFFADAIERRP